MRTLYSFATVVIFGAAIAALTPACSSDSDSSGGTAGAPAAGGAKGTAGAAAVAGSPGAAGAAGAAAVLVGNATTGAATYKDAKGGACDSCHGPAAAGLQGPNITFSLTNGIGTWTQQQFHDAVRFGKNKDGTMLCAFMTPFEEKYISEQGIADVYAYLKSLPVVDVHQQGTYCPD